MKSIIAAIIFTAIGSSTYAGIIQITNYRSSAYIATIFTDEKGNTDAFKYNGGSSTIGYYSALDLEPLTTNTVAFGPDSSLSNGAILPNQFDLFTETEQFGDGGINSPDFIYSKLVSQVYVEAIVNLDFLFDVKGTDVSFSAGIFAECSICLDSFVSIVDLNSGFVVLDLVGGWANREFISLTQGSYRLSAQAREVNGDDDTETEVYVQFRDAEKIIKVPEPAPLVLLIIGISLLSFKRIISRYPAGYPFTT